MREKKVWLILTYNLAYDDQFLYKAIYLVGALTFAVFVLVHNFTACRVQAIYAMDMMGVGHGRQEAPLV